jgi:hypothetical protein
MCADPRIAFVIPYYGRWPWYWPIWASSAGANPQFDFLFLTDLPSPEPRPKNVRMIQMPYSEVLSRISSVIGIDVQATYHKLTDFRPFFGLAFSEHLSSYTYWGYCDVDLFFGDLGPLLEKAGSQEFDFISPWIHTAGHCTLIRNTERVNHIGLTIPNVKSRALIPHTTFMDEGGLAETAFHAGGFSFGVVADLAAEWRKPKCFLGATAEPTRRLGGLAGPFILHYTKGRIIVHDQHLASHEVLYFHFMGMKAKRFWERYFEEGGAHWDELSFTPYGVVRGLVEPAAIRTWGYRYRCWSTGVPGFLYRSLRSNLPQPVFNWVKRRRSRQVVQGSKAKC